MEQRQSTTNSAVFNACARLVYELDIEENKKSPYFLPYTNYVMSWCNYIPINTIIIGQNPYPQDIYSEYGSAFAYDETKSLPPKSVQVLAKDLYNYDSTEIQVSTECFGNSWRLLDVGVILINETVYDKITSVKKNTRGIREMEAQCRALQVVLAESFFSGQTTITCIGMGIPAASMTSIIRSWYPKDLFKMRIMTCRNPAARDIGDLPSHQVTVGKTAVSKVLSEIVSLYARMSYPRNSAQEKRVKQNTIALKEGANNVSVSADQYMSELQSFEDRLKSVQGGGDASSSFDSILQSSGFLRKSIDVHRNALMSHNITLLMIVESIGRTTPAQETNKTLQPPSASTIVGKAGGARRRTPNRAQHSTTVESVPEVVEPTIEHYKQEENTPSIVPSRARRRVSRQPSYAQSNAGTEYTGVSTIDPLDKDKEGDMSRVESIIMKVFANWCNEHSKDPVCYELLFNAADSQTILSPLVKELLGYIRDRREGDTQYDAYDELTNPDSGSSVWAKDNLVADT